MKDFDYQEQLLLWRKNQLLLQKKYADTPPGFFSAEAEKAAWEAWEEEYTRFLEHRHCKINDTSLPSVSFPLIGREEELIAVRNIRIFFPNLKSWRMCLPWKRNQQRLFPYTRRY